MFRLTFEKPKHSNYLRNLKLKDLISFYIINSFIPELHNFQKNIFFMYKVQTEKQESAVHCTVYKPEKALLLSELFQYTKIICINQISCKRVIVLLWPLVPN